MLHENYAINPLRYQDTCTKSSVAQNFKDAMTTNGSYGRNTFCVTVRTVKWAFKGLYRCQILLLWPFTYM